MSYPKQSHWPPQGYDRRQRPERYRHANRENFERLEKYRPLRGSLGALNVKAQIEEDAIATIGDAWPINAPPVDLKLFRD